MGQFVHIPAEKVARGMQRHGELIAKHSRLVELHELRLTAADAIRRRRDTDAVSAPIADTAPDAGEEI